MKTLTLKLQKDKLVSERKRLIGLGYAVIYYPANWGGNAHFNNRSWCVAGNPDETDYGTLRYLERSLKEANRKYVIIRTKRTPLKK